MIDLDANATTAPLPEVVAVVSEQMALSYGNPGSRHALGRRARRVLEESRESIAALLGAHPDELIFTSGGTESINTALHGLLARPGHLLAPEGEHPATLETLRSLALRHNAPLHLWPLEKHGAISRLALAATPWSTARLATVLLAHNETGVIQSLDEISERCKAYHVPLHVDGVQAVGKIPVDFAQLGCDALSFAGHKFHGPRGIGGLLLRRGRRLTPLLTGGHQETDRRAGTEVVALAAGMALALQMWSQQQNQRTAWVTARRDELIEQLRRHCPDMVVHASEALRLPNTVNIGFPNVAGEALLVALDLAGVGCSLGSACASGSSEPSPVLIAMGIPPALARSSLRFSLSFHITPDDVKTAAIRIHTLVERLRIHSRGV